MWRCETHECYLELVIFAGTDPPAAPADPPLLVFKPPVMLRRIEDTWPSRTTFQVAVVVSALVQAAIGFRSNGDRCAGERLRLHAQPEAAQLAIECGRRC